MQGGSQSLTVHEHTYPGRRPPVLARAPYNPQGSFVATSRSSVLPYAGRPRTPTLDEPAAHTTTGRSRSLVRHLPQHRQQPPPPPQRYMYCYVLRYYTSESISTGSALSRPSPSERGTKRFKATCVRTRNATWNRRRNGSCVACVVAAGARPPLPSCFRGAPFLGYRGPGFRRAATWRPDLCCRWRRSQGRD